MPRTEKTLQTGQTTVGTSAVQVTSSDIGCVQGVTVRAAAANAGTVYIGNSSGVTTSTGFELGAGQAEFFAVEKVDLLYAIASEASQSISWKAE